MSSQSGSSRFQSLFESALQDYEQKTNIKLAEHPLAETLEKCDSVVDIIALLQERARAFRGSDKIMKSIECTVAVIHKISDMADAIGLVRSKTLVRSFHVSDTHTF